MRCYQAMSIEATLNVMPRFNKLVLELVEARVRDTEGVGLHHLQMVVRIIPQFLGHGLRLETHLIRRR
jgi:hypothetical protein